MSSLPSSWETFVTTVCNASTTAIKYSEVTSAIVTEAARRKSFTKDSAEEAYVDKFRPTDRTTGEEVIPDRRTISEAGASPVTTVLGVGEAAYAEEITQQSVS